MTWQKPEVVLETIQTVITSGRPGRGVRQFWVCFHPDNIVTYLILLKKNQSNQNGLHKVTCLSDSFCSSIETD